MIIQKIHRQMIAKFFIKVERFLPLIDTAIEQATLFCEDSQQLVNELGTSVGRLIEEMRGCENS